MTRAVQQIIYYSMSKFVIVGTLLLCATRSTDYGVSFSNINLRLEATGTLQLWNNFFVSPEDYNQVNECSRVYRGPSMGYAWQLSLQW